jgi:hypothetical protein
MQPVTTVDGSSNTPLMSDGPSLLLGLVEIAHVPRAHSSNGQLMS